MGKTVFLSEILPPPSFFCRRHSAISQNEAACRVCVCVTSLFRWLLDCGSATTIAVSFILINLYGMHNQAKWFMCALAFRKAMCLIISSMSCNVRKCHKCIHTHAGIICSPYLALLARAPQLWSSFTYNCMACV